MDIVTYCRQLARQVRVWAAGADQPVIPYVRPYADNVREYTISERKRQAFTAATVNVALPLLGGSREIYVYATAKCFFRTGDNGVTASAATGHDLGAEERWHLRVPEGHTHLAVIRDTSDGTLSIVPVAG